MPAEEGDYPTGEEEAKIEKEKKRKRKKRETFSKHTILSPPSHPSTTILNIKLIPSQQYGKDDKETDDNVAGEEDEEGEVKLSLADEELLADLTYDELKQAFRFITIIIIEALNPPPSPHHKTNFSLSSSSCSLPSKVFSFFHLKEHEKSRSR